MALWLCLRYIVLSGWHGRYVEEYSDEDDDVDAIEDLFANYGSGSCMLHRSVSALHAVLYGARLHCGSCHAVLYVPPPLRCAVSANDRERPRLLRHAAPLAVAVAAAQCGHYTRCSCTVPHSHCETVTAPRSACKRWRARPKARPGLSGVRASAGPRRRRRQRNIQMQHAQYNVDALVIRCDIYAMHSARERSACAARFAQQLSHRGHPSLQHRTAYCRRNGLSTKRHCDSPVRSSSNWSVESHGSL